MVIASLKNLQYGHTGIIANKHKTHDPIVNKSQWDFYLDWS